MTSDLDRITTVVLGMPGPSGAGITPSEKTTIDSRLAALESGLMINADDYADLNDAITAAVAAGGVPVWIPTARTQTTPVVIPTGLKDGLRLWGIGIAASITYSGSDAFFTTDPTGTPTDLTQRTHWELRNLSIVGPGSGSAGSIGLKIVNSAVGHLFDVRINGFETGVLYDGLNAANGATCYYNDAYHLRVRQCKDAVVLRNGANSNEFFGGSFVSSERGVVLTNVNAVDFHGVDIEANTVYGAYIDANKNRFFGGRFENPSATKEIIFYDGNGRGIGNRVDSYFSEVAIESAITWDADRDNLVTDSGYFNLGSSDAAANTFFMKGKRTVSADGEPFVDFADEYSPSGAPIGFQYATVRASSIGFQLIKSGFAVLRLALTSGSKPRLEFGDPATGTMDTVWYRDAADTMKTDDKLVVGSTVGILKLEPISLPGTCAVGEMCVDNADKKLKVCTASNTWTVVGAQT
jgi:hypothetical protein